MLAGFARHQRRPADRSGRPLVATAEVATRAVRWGLTAFALTVSTYFALLFVLALYLQQGLGKSPAYSGMAMLTWVVAFGLSGLVLPRVPERLRRAVPAVGCLLLAAGYVGVGVSPGRAALRAAALPAAGAGRAGPRGSATTR